MRTFSLMTRPPLGDKADNRETLFRARHFDAAVGQIRHKIMRDEAPSLRQIDYVLYRVLTDEGVRRWSHWAEDNRVPIEQAFVHNPDATRIRIGNMTPTNPGGNDFRVWCVEICQQSALGRYWDGANPYPPDALLIDDPVWWAPPACVEYDDKKKMTEDSAALLAVVQQRVQAPLVANFGDLPSAMRLELQWPGLWKRGIMAQVAIDASWRDQEGYVEQARAFIARHPDVPLYLGLQGGKHVWAAQVAAWLDAPNVFWQHNTTLAGQSNEPIRSWNYNPVMRP